MKIAIDGACLANARGYGRFARELVGAMIHAAPSDEFVLFVDRRAAPHASFGGARLVVVEQGVSPTIAASASGSRSVSDMLRFTRAVRREGADVFFCPSVYTFFPLPLGLPAVITIHDAIAERFPAMTFASRRAQLFWALKTRLALWQATIVLTVSEFASREVQAVHHVPASRIRVAVEAPAAEYRPSDDPADIERVARDAGVPPGAEWFVYVGGFNPHKHLEYIARAHAAVARGRANPPHLVLVGTIDSDVFHGARDEVLAEITRAGTESLVHWPGFVPDEELRHLLSGAVALLLPSESEGFGLPAVEAAACGTPVIATTESPLPELLAGGGIFIGPRDAAGLEQAMTSLLDFPETRRAMGARARERASALSWEAAAQSTLAALRDAAS